jgi:preprotein translocase subunit SecG
MYGFFLTILILNGIFLTVVILLQAGKGGGLAAMGGGVTATEGVLGGRQAATFLTRATWTAGTIFMVLSLILSIMSSRAQGPGSILQDDLRQIPTAPSPVLPGQEAPPGGGAPEQPGAVPPS